jgi:hypothetical protein
MMYHSVFNAVKYFLASSAKHQINPQLISQGHKLIFWAHQQHMASTLQRLSRFTVRSFVTHERALLAYMPNPIGTKPTRQAVLPKRAIIARSGLVRQIHFFNQKKCFLWL